jgi:hypothetical protein
MNEKSRADRLMEITLEITDLDSKRESLYKRIYALEQEKKKILRDEAASKCGAPEWLLK